MPQHDYNIANASGAVVRADLNDALSAIATTNSGAAAPAALFAHQFWADLTAGLLRMRNAANTDWVTVGTLGADRLGAITTAGNVTITGPITMSGAPLNTAMSTIPAAATLPLAAATNEVEITGNNVTITGIDAAPAGAVRTCRVTGTGIVLAHSGTFQLAGNANVALNQWDVFRARSHGGGAWTVNEVFRFGSLPMLQSGGNFTGPVTLHADPTLALHASTRQFVLAQSAMTLLQTQSFGSVGAVNFVNLTGFRSYMFMLENVFPGTDGADLGMRVSSDNGASWFATHGDYTSTGIRNVIGSPLTGFGANPGGYIRLLDIVRNSAGVSGQITWSGFNVAGTHKRATTLLTGLLNDGNVHWASGSGSLISSAVALNGVQFLTGSGNFGSGVISCYGIRG